MPQHAGHFVEVRALAHRVFSEELSRRSGSALVQCRLCRSPQTHAINPWSLLKRRVTQRCCYSYGVLRPCRRVHCGASFMLGSHSGAFCSRTFFAGSWPCMVIRCRSLCGLSLPVSGCINGICIRPRAPQRLPDHPSPWSPIWAQYQRPNIQSECKEPCIRGESRGTARP